MTRFYFRTILFALSALCTAKQFVFFAVASIIIFIGVGCVEIRYSKAVPYPSATNIGEFLPSLTPEKMSIDTGTPSRTTPPTPTPKTSLSSTIAPPTNRPSLAVETRTPTEIKISESSLVIKSYPYKDYLHQKEDPKNKFVFNALDQTALERLVGTKSTTTKTLRTVVVENEFLSLEFLPEIGGRLFQVIYKPTNQPLLYNNNVLKPTLWGPTNQGGWLAVGGMEWAFPVNEHGYEWGNPWLIKTGQNPQGATVNLEDSKNNSNIRVTISITLPVHSAYFIVHPRIENASTNQVPLQFWINAQIALNKQRVVSPNTEFVLPTQSVYVHSTGDQFIPSQYIPSGNALAPSAPMPWPVIAGRDLSHYQNWSDYLGVFVVNPAVPYMGAYDHNSQIGIARVFPLDQVRGLKLFAFGSNYCCGSQFTDDGSDYFELWGGIPRTFFPSDDVILAPGEVREWDEYWLPFSRTGGLSAANKDAVLSVKSQSGEIMIGAYSAINRKVTIILDEGSESKQWERTLSPTNPFVTSVPSGNKNPIVRLFDAQGQLIVASGP